MKDAQQRIHVIVVEEGKATELHNLSNDTLLRLENAYEKAPITGLSQSTYVAIADMFEAKLAVYEQELNNDTDKNEMFEKSVAFAKAFGISYDESPALFDLMLQIERRVKDEKVDFDSKSICIKNLKSMIDMDWRDANKDFRNWARKLFEDTGLRIGIIRMSKFYFGVITQLV